jgi:hypothetical protein
MERTSVNFRKFAGLLAILSTAFDSGELSEEKVSLYWEMLQDIPSEAFEEGVKKILRTRVFAKLPTIAEIRKASLEMTDEELDYRAIFGWTQAISALKKGDHSNDILNEAVNLAFGGWDAFGNLRLENEPSDRKHFIASFKLVAQLRAEKRLLESGSSVKMIEEKKR